MLYFVHHGARLLEEWEAMLCALLTNKLKTPMCESFNKRHGVWQVRVYHDNTGASPSWYLEELRVRRAGSSGEWTVFPCQRWLAVDEEDG